MRYVLFAVSITASILAWHFRSGLPTPPNAPYAAAQSFVRQSLERPETAVFPPAFSATQTAPDRWAVWSYVDAKDGAGNDVRTTWKIELIERSGSYALAGYHKYTGEPRPPADASGSRWP